MADGLGAGDALLAASSLALKASGNEVIAAILGNVAAAVACETEGNRPLTIEQILDKINILKNN